MLRTNLSQEYDCPHGSDSDINEPNLVHHGQKFHCHWCGGEHTAGVDVQVSTIRDWRDYPALPKSAEELQALINEDDTPKITDQELHALRKKVATYEARDALGLVPQPAGARGPDGKEWAKTAAGYQHVEAMLPCADGHQSVGPYWYGWALRSAFVAGAEWQEARNPHAPAITYLPLTLAEARDLTCMLAGAPWPDEMLPELQQLLGIYDGLRAHGQRPVDPATLPRKVAKAVMKTGLLPATPQQPAPSAELLSIAKRLAVATDEGDDQAQGTHYVDKQGVIRCKGSFLSLIEDARAAICSAASKPSPSPQADSGALHAELRKTWAPGQRWQSRFKGESEYRDISQPQPSWSGQKEYRRHPDDVAPQADSQPAPVVDYPPLPDLISSVWPFIHTNAAADSAAMVAKTSDQVDAAIHDLLRAYVDADRAARAPADSVTAPAGGDSRVPEAWTNLLAYVLQDDLHNRLTPRVIDIAYTAFMQAKRPNDEDGGASDWFTDTRPMVRELIAKLRKDLIEELVTPPAQAADSVLEDAARLEQIAEAIRDYHHALDLRKHGGLAESAAFNSICQTMGMPWNQGEEAARRAATQQGGA